MQLMSHTALLFVQNIVDPWPPLAMSTQSGLNLFIFNSLRHICVSKLTIIGSDNGLSPNRHQAMIWTNSGLLLTGPLGTNFSEILIEILTFSFKKMHLEVSSAKRRPFCLGLNVLIETNEVFDRITEWKGHGGLLLEFPCHWMVEWLAIWSLETTKRSYRPDEDNTESLKSDCHRYQE